MRDMNAKPYSPDEERVVDYFNSVGIGGGDDPIGALISSHAIHAINNRRRGDQVISMKHTYPSRHPKGSHWATDEAWEMLDRFRPGLIPDDVRLWLAGNIAGALVRVAEEGSPEKQSKG